jgi:hypothetical protein
MRSFLPQMRSFLFQMRIFLFQVRSSLTWTETPAMSPGLRSLQNPITRLPRSLADSSL